jgi:hypothetical protein
MDPVATTGFRVTTKKKSKPFNVRFKNNGVPTFSDRMLGALQELCCGLEIEDDEVKSLSFLRGTETTQLYRVSKYGRHLDVEWEVLGDDGEIMLSGEQHVHLSSPNITATVTDSLVFRFLNTEA